MQAGVGGADRELEDWKVEDVRGGGRVGDSSDSDREGSPKLRLILDLT